MKTLSAIMMFALATLLCHAQDYKLGNVTVAELEEKAHPKDASAPAAVLFAVGQTTISYTESKGFVATTEVDMKIKIYNKDGYAYANKIVGLYYVDSDSESVDFSKAYTYNLVNGKIEKTKLKSEGEFFEVVSKNWKRKKIMMPDVKEGSIVEYRFTLISPFLSTLYEWDFQRSIPVNHSGYTTRIPEYYMYSPNFRGTITPAVKKTRGTKSIRWTEKERNTSGHGTVTTTFSNEKVDYQEDVAEYIIKDIPALKEESFVSNIDNYNCTIEHELTMIRRPNEPMKPLSTTWEELAKTIYRLDDFGPELKKNGYYEDEVKGIIAPLKTPAEKTAAIFSFVKNTMNWNGDYGYTARQGVKKAYKEKSGSVGDINLMLTSMLRYAGIDANPVLVSTRDRKVPLFPSHSAYNYVICAVNIDGKYALLDATSKYTVPNVLPTRAINWIGRLIKDDGISMEINLMPEQLSREVIVLSAKLDATGKCTGKARDQYFDQDAYHFRENYMSVNKDTYIEKLEKRYTGLEVDGYKTQNDKELSKPIMEEYDFAYNNAAEIIGDKMYFNPMMFFARSENPFKQDKREYPVDFVYPNQEKYMISISIPDGYVVESIPESINMSMEEGIGNFKFTLQQQGNSIQLMATTDINYAVVPADYYGTLKNFFQKKVEKETEKVVLKKS
ncbi:DUF3857 domain-containing protein [Flavobacterium sp. RHBU_3]|uniref:DUF3857 domain-containing protein n=1 Tax=Flavobacterium sp. RHBU_3 TaxID=3391184 RepID=UPI003985274B